ncbi:NERD domain-containing protein [Virgibacillus sp. W0181]|uniref:NERD domain-containing protein n=1 Tax=Virgibacillus sp. W0181 TaxID=3391581 RepID=UPI003F467311
MAQLVKLKDYVSRYEWNAYRYPSQYIRLKKDNWQKLVQLWINEQNEERDNEEEAFTGSKSRKFFKMGKEHPDEETQANKLGLPKEKLELKHYFLDQLFPIQLKWATSTVSEVSFTDQKYKSDRNLKYFLQRIPDIYLMMYYPIFNIKKAPIEGEIILISPIGIEIIYLMEDDPHATIMAGNDRTWSIDNGDTVIKHISPLISLKRTEQIIRSILNTYKIDFTIKKTVVSRINNIIFTTEPYHTKIIGKAQYDEWFKEKRQLKTSLKSVQLKAMEALLKHCQTTSIKRPEWEEVHTDTFTLHEEQETDGID